MPATSVHSRSAIAVLPFQNLSADGVNAYFAGGLHDELLTQLAKVTSLKVISRTSVMSYQGTTKPLTQIADELGVGSVVEGTVQVVGERLRVNVQLIDAATDQHLWADRYDRTLDDAFAIQSDVAQRIVTAVGAALTDGERNGLAAAPTADADAYRFYLQGRESYRRPGYLRPNLESAQRLFEQAIARDPKFALAHAGLADVHGRKRWQMYDPTPGRLTLQRDEAETALRLAPELPRAHVAMGNVHYQGERDWRQALDEYALALQGAPNDAEVVALVAYSHRRLGNWEQVFALFQKAADLNPRDADLFFDLGASTYDFVRRYADGVRTYDRALALAPDYHVAAVYRGWAQVRWHAQLGAVREVLNRVPDEADLGELQSVAAQRAALLLLERNADALLQMFGSAPVAVFDGQRFFLPSALYVCWAHELHGDDVSARAACETALARLDPAVRELAGDWRIHVARGLALAGLGRRGEALREARWLQQSEIYSGDVIESTFLAEDRARTLARAGDAEAALDEIERLLAGPSMLSVHTLRLDPRWDPIRHYPRFNALLARYSAAESR